MLLTEGGDPFGCKNTYDTAICSCALQDKQQDMADLDADGGLVILVGGEYLRFLGGDGCVLVDDFCHETSSSLNAHRQGAHIHQQNLFGLQNAKFLSNLQNQCGQA